MLAVDDSATVRASVKLILEKAGYEVDIACDGEDAVKKVEGSGQRFDLVITDLNMPKVDGINLIKSLRSMSLFRFTPILMLTTESQAAKKEEGKKAGATGWIVKPFQPEQLVAVVQKVVR